MEVITIYELPDKEVTNLNRRQVEDLIFFHKALSYHLRKIALATHRSEALYHWRQCKFYVQEGRGIVNAEDKQITNEEYSEMFAGLSAEGKSPLLDEAIKKWELIKE